MCLLEFRARPTYVQDPLRVLDRSEIQFVSERHDAEVVSLQSISASVFYKGDVVDRTQWLHGCFACHRWEPSTPRLLIIPSAQLLCEEWEKTSLTISMIRPAILMPIHPRGRSHCPTAIWHISRVRQSQSRHYCQFLMNTRSVDARGVSPGIIVIIVLICILAVLRIFSAACRIPVGRGRDVGARSG